MKVVNIEEITPTKRKITLEVAPEDLVTEREEAYAELGKEVALPGFRKGKVPRQFLEYRFEKSIRKEAFGDAVHKGLTEAIKENDLTPVSKADFGDADLDALAEKAGEEGVELALTLEVVPSFEIPEYEGQTFDIEDVSITDKEIDNVLERERETGAYFIAVDDRPTREGDFVIANLRTTRGEEELAPFTNSRAVLPSLGAGEVLKPLEDKLIGILRGESFSFDIDTPEDHPLHESDGINTLHVEGKIQQISERSLPEVDDDFAKDQGYGSMEDYRHAIRHALEHAHERMVERRKKDAVVEHLMTKTDIKIPSSLIQSNYLNLKISEQMRQREQGNRLSISPREQRQQEMDMMYQAEEMAKERLILMKIADKKEIQVDDDEYMREMAAVARSRGEKNLDKFLADIDKRGLEDNYKETILLGKVEDWLLKNNQFNLKSAEA